jgi:sugar/nucleoside kinase (ribokinase family)
MIPVGLFVGLTTVDLVHRVERPPGPDEKVVATRADIAAGGPAANAAVTFAALGGRVVLLTALGGGVVASLARADLLACRVQVVDASAAPVRDGEPVVDTPISAVTVVESSGERSVVSRNAEGVDVDVPVDLATLVSAAAVVLLDGHHPALALAAAHAADAAGVPVVLDAGSWKPVLPELLPHVTAAVCSADFALPGVVGDLDAMARALLAAGPAFVAVTAGPAPVRWWAGGDHGGVDVPAVLVRDTLGAGDVLHGAYAYAVASGVADPVLALRFAIDVAGIRVAHTGPRSWLGDPRLAELVRALVAEVAA